MALKTLVICMIVAFQSAAQDAPAEQAEKPLPETIAYWRFEPAQVSKDPFPHTDFAKRADPAVLDATGNKNNLYRFSEFAQPKLMRSQLPAREIPQTGAENTRSLYIPSIEKTRHFQDLFASSAMSKPAAANDISRPHWDAWTIEFSFAPNDIRERQTVLGYDYEVAVKGKNTPVFACQIDDGLLKLTMIDKEGKKVTTQGKYRVGARRWTHAAVVFDGEQATLYIQRIARKGYEASDPVALAGGLYGERSDSDNAYGPLWTVGRGVQDGQNAYPYEGYVDEVRFSRRALKPSELLFTTAEKEDAGE